MCAPPTLKRAPRSTSSHATDAPSPAANTWISLRFIVLPWLFFCQTRTPIAPLATHGTFSSNHGVGSVVVKHSVQPSKLLLPPSPGTRVAVASAVQTSHPPPAPSRSTEPVASTWSRLCTVTLTMSVASKYMSRRPLWLDSTQPSAAPSSTLPS